MNIDPIPNGMYMSYELTCCACGCSKDIIRVVPESKAPCPIDCFTNDNWDYFGIVMLGEICDNCRKDYTACYDIYFN